MEPSKTELLAISAFKHFLHKTILTTQAPSMGLFYGQISCQTEQRSTQGMIGTVVMTAIIIREW